MKVLVCGGRDFSDYDYLESVLNEVDSKTPILELAQGGARGADSLAHKWAVENGIYKICTFIADWDTHGRAAGPIRNRQMLNEFQPDLVVAFPGGFGTEHMIAIALEAGVEVIRA